MTVAPHEIPFVLLATTGERMGWIYTDRQLYRRRFTEPPPQLEPVSPDLYELLERSAARKKKRRRNAIQAGLALAFLIYCLGMIQAPDTGGRKEIDPSFVTLAQLALVAGVVGAILAGLGPHLARRAITVAETGNLAAHAAAEEAWKQRRDDHERQQQATLDAMNEWSAATPSPGDRRIDIIGGTTYGWEAVLTVHGGSLLVTRGPMTLVDFTGDTVCEELIQLATATRRSVRRLRLPTELAEFDLLAGLTPGELVDCLVEAMHGDAQGAGRADRSQDALVLREIVTALDGRITLTRLLAALRVLTDRPDPDGLTPQESERLLDLQPDENRRRLYTQMRRIEAFLHPLETMGSRAEGGAGTADLTCLIADGEGGDAQNDLFKDLLVQWLTRLVRRDSQPMGSLVLLGADEVHHRAIERLSTLCERHGVRLVLFFSHLRAEALHTIGGGEVAFMRLGNHHEAGQAAEYIGKGHKFVLSQLTRTLGGNDTHTMADTSGQSRAEGGSGGMSYGKRGRGRSYGKNWSRTRTWSQTLSTARSTNWNDASSVQRVHEYTVEPRVLQELPEYAMVLVKEQNQETVVQAVEVDPAIVMLPRVSMQPAGPMPLPDPEEAVVPAPAQPFDRSPVIRSGRPQ
ncbi:hypothetical protein JIG36_48360 [Actinoplanes sp. LDG1-06]|uniref:Uncharacterized protein n=1 Tax=Paractinoplanes ovalisporus TaxID=2810368 RepID=A0ABS2AU04_9ACTN|nr:hypothetical protein [Actinoplanes ovalisporus]MBM2623337.1 hypothetical protein [Actinoplanes ovalisporus]